MSKLIFSVIIASALGACLGNFTNSQPMACALPIRQLSPADQALLINWGFSEKDKFWLLDTFRNPLRSTRIYLNVSKLKNLPDSGEDNRFRLLDYAVVGTEMFGQVPTEADLLLLLPHLLERNANPNIPIALDLSSGMFTKVLVAPLIFLAIQPRYHRLLVSLLRYPEVDVNVREGTVDQQWYVRNPMSSVDPELMNEKREPQTPLHYVIREIVKCQDEKCRNKWFSSLHVLLQRKDIDLHAKLTFYTDQGAVEKTAFDLAEGNEIVLYLLNITQARYQRISQVPEINEPEQPELRGAVPISAVGSSGGPILSGTPFSLKKFVSTDKKEKEKLKRHDIMPATGVKIPNPVVTPASFLERIDDSNLMKVASRLIPAGLVSLIGYLSYLLWNKQPTKVEEINSSISPTNVTQDTAANNTSDISDCLENIADTLKDGEVQVE